MYKKLRSLKFTLKIFIGRTSPRSTQKYLQRKCYKFWDRTDLQPFTRQQLVVQRELLTHRRLLRRRLLLVHVRVVETFGQRSGTALAAAPATLPAPAPALPGDDCRHHSHFQLQLLEREVRKNESGFFLRGGRLDDDGLVIVGLCHFWFWVRLLAVKFRLLVNLFNIGLYIL